VTTGPLACVGADAAFEAAYVDADGIESRVVWDQMAGVALEWGRPVRRFPSYRGQRNYPGLYWSATTGGHVGYESWVERDHLIALDFDQSVIGTASQPFWLFWRNGDGVQRRHARLLRPVGQRRCTGDRFQAERTRPAARRCGVRRDRAGMPAAGLGLHGVGRR